MIVINKLYEELEEEHRVIEAELKTYQIELKESKDELKALDKEILRLLLDDEDEDCQVLRSGIPIYYVSDS